MLLGIWRNFDELEDSLSYPELSAMLTAKREVDERNMKFQAALQGIDMDKDKGAAEDPVEQAKLRARARLAGVDENEFRFKESTSAAGFDVVTID